MFYECAFCACVCVCVIALTSMLILCYVSTVVNEWVYYVHHISSCSQDLSAGDSFTLHQRLWVGSVILHGTSTGSYIQQHIMTELTMFFYSSSCLPDIRTSYKVNTIQKDFHNQDSDLQQLKLTISFPKECFVQGRFLNRLFLTIVLKLLRVLK